MKYLFTFFLLTYFVLGFAQDYRNFYASVNISKQEKGLALILANDEYSNIKRLSSAVEDGKSMINALKEVNFDIEIGFNLNRQQSLNIIDEFSKKLPDYKYAIVYFAGHGVQFGDKNFILPTDANGNTEFKIKNASLDVMQLLKSLEQIKIPKAIVLDACRENPFLKQLPAKTRSVAGSGLAEIKANENSIVIFSTAANTMVPDDNKFTEILAENIKIGGCIDDILRKTRNTIIEIDENQLVFSREALLRDICFGDIIEPVSLEDLDNDGIANYADQCPNKKGPLENFGCPYGDQFEENVLSHLAKEGKVGMIDALGEVVIQPIYDMIFPFKQDGIAIVLNKGKWGYVNKQGEEVVPLENDYVSEFMHGRGVVINDGNYSLIDVNGKKIYLDDSTLKFYLDKEQPFIITRKNNLYGISDLDGKTIISPKYQSSIRFSNGLAKAILNGKNLYLNVDGEIKLVNNFDFSSDFKNGKAVIVHDNRIGVINRSGDLLFWLPRKFVASNYHKISLSYDRNGYLKLTSLNDKNPDEIFDSEGYRLNYEGRVKELMSNGAVLDFGDKIRYSYRYSKKIILRREHIGMTDFPIQSETAVFALEDKNFFYAKNKIFNLQYKEVVNIKDRVKNYGFEIKGEIARIEKDRGVLALMDYEYDENGVSVVYLDSYFRPITRITFADQTRILQKPYYESNKFTSHDQLITFHDSQNGLVGVYNLRELKKAQEGFFEKIEPLFNDKEIYVFEVNEKYGLYDGQNNEIIVDAHFWSIYKSYGSIKLNLYRYSDEMEVEYNIDGKCFDFGYEKYNKKRKLFDKKNIPFNKCD